MSSPRTPHTGLQKLVAWLAERALAKDTEIERLLLVAYPPVEVMSPEGTLVCVSYNTYRTWLV